MELRIDEVQLPEQIKFNYDELKTELTEKVHVYETIVYDDDQIKEAKADRASLNKLKKALNDERIRREREYMKPFNDFKTKINEIISIIDKPVAIIDAQVKDYENKKRDEKNNAIINLFECKEHRPDWLKLVMIFDESWLNASVSLKSISETMDARIEQINADIDTLAKLPTFCFEATEEYKHTLDINRAIAEGQRLTELQQRKAEAEARKKAMQEAPAEATPQADAPQIAPAQQTASPASWVSFSAFLNVEQAKALKTFFEANYIQYKRI